MTATDGLTLDEHGARRMSAVLGDTDRQALLELCDNLLCGAAGHRIFGVELVQRLSAEDGAIGRLASSSLPGARPVRAVLFDKTPTNNWTVAWHQDRTIAVRRRLEVDGFGPWSVKAGLAHVEPPFDVLAGMITLRAHLDDCGPDNAPLLVALGSHRVGRVAAGEAAARATEMEVAVCTAEAGDVWVYATPVLHASEAAVRPGRRRVLQMDFAASNLPGGLDWAGI